MRNVALIVVAACALLATAGTVSAKAKRYFVYRTGPEVLVVADPSGYAEPQVYVRRYELVPADYVVPGFYWGPGYATCAHPRRTARACNLNGRY